MTRPTSRDEAPAAGLEEQGLVVARRPRPGELHFAEPGADPKIHTAG